MLLRVYVFLWILCSCFFSYEFYALNTEKVPSLLKILEAQGKIAIKISPEPGRPLSLWLGWIGLMLMVVMNVYSMRRRMKFLSGLGKLSDWLNFHIFCGLVGPTFILFHCNFKVRGLVGISFWSMVVSFTSGIIGRYFYLQLTSKKKDLEKVAEGWRSRLKKVIERSKNVWDEKESQTYLVQALDHVGYPRGEGIPNPFFAFALSMVGDVRLVFSQPKRAPSWPVVSSHVLREYALTTRRAAFLESFQKLMGYWHAFHFPFAIFMYISAVIHVTAALVLGV